MSEPLRDDALLHLDRVADPNDEGIYGHMDAQSALHVRALVAEIRAHRASSTHRQSKWGEVIGGVARIPHEAIAAFVQRSDEHLAMKADNGTEDYTSRLLDDALTNIRQLLAEHHVTPVPRLTPDEVEALRGAVTFFVGSGDRPETRRALAVFDKLLGAVT